MKLTKFDVLWYLEIGEGVRESLLGDIRGNAKFERISERILNSRIGDLKKEGLVVERKRGRLEINRDGKRAEDCLAFLYWARMRGIDYNSLLEGKVIKVFKEVVEGRKTIEDLRRGTKLSKPTLFKVIRILKDNNFVGVVRKKPLVLRANLNDLTFFYLNWQEFSLNSWGESFKIPDFPEIHSPRIVEKIIKLHTYSTTVTEGNTATEKEVERVLGNYPVDLTPREIMEILNTKKALEVLYRIKKEEIEIDKIKELHGVVMFNLVKSAGKFYYGEKRIIGSELRPPKDKQVIETSLNAMLNFIRKYAGQLNPLILASLVHFIFVTIHPFQDGNGRMGRLLHSWILLRNNLPLFVFDPGKRGRYFDALEKGRKEGVEEFTEFCLKEMSAVLSEIIK